MRCQPPTLRKDLGVDIQTIKALRSETGLGLAECKEALAASNGDLRAARAWLEQRGLYRPKAIDKGALRRAVTENDRATVERWLEGGGAIDEDFAGQSLLYLASLANAVDVVQLALARGAATEQAVQAPWHPRRLPSLRLIAAHAHEGRLLRALLASLTDAALTEGEEAVLFLADQLGEERLSEREVVLRIAECGCAGLMARWPAPAETLARTLTEEEATRYAALFGRHGRPSTVREVFEMSHRRVRGVLAICETEKRRGEYVSATDEARYRASLARMEACARWLHQHAPRVEDGREDTEAT